ncbi:YicC/YloC family endoribonuclease [Anaerobaca lacustris]|uniref:YicC/YloC family endoribonuclease n=1 Tax=Anaerobaca lacustris TaxID=3044600 RepID=A0AAW6TS23_9BACT|nr:YicC/YloC family endoribonuclease [Sedimentisphaerales bacterium M17dextr]
MLISMTGYGGADGQLDGVCYAVEIKAVNNRYLKTIIKLPEAVAFLEDDIDKLLRKNLSRGTINCVVRLKGVAASALFEIDEVALRSVVERLNAVGSSVGVGGTIDLASLLDLPGVVHPVLPDERESQKIRDVVLAITSEAIGRLQQMREAEGRFLEADLKGHCQAMARELECIRQKCDGLIKEYAKRLRKRVDGLLAEAKLKLDEETLSREVAILADRSDISEEIARLDAHLQQFGQICETEGQAGRRLDFLSQEMLREANTVASKAADAEIVRRVVDMKCLIERLKEQIQNVE